MEDTQNSAPGSVQAAKLGGARKAPDAQSVKRYEDLVESCCFALPTDGLTLLPQVTDGADAAHDLTRPRRLCLPLGGRQPNVLDGDDRGT